MKHLHLRLGNEGGFLRDDSETEDQREPDGEEERCENTQDRFLTITQLIPDKLLGFEDGLTLPTGSCAPADALNFSTLQVFVLKMQNPAIPRQGLQKQQHRPRRI